MKSTLKYFVVVAIASFVIGLPWVNAQGTGPKYEVVSTPICWQTGGTDSNLIRYSLISPSSGQPNALFYINSLGAVINPTGGILKMGWCCNCSGTGGGTTFTPLASNGLNMDGDSTKLGGELNQETVISSNSHLLKIGRTATNNNYYLIVDPAGKIVSALTEDSNFLGFMGQQGTGWGYQSLEKATNYVGTLQIGYSEGEYALGDATTGEYFSGLFLYRNQTAFEYNGIRVYASTAAAQADATFQVGGIYRLTGDSVLRIKTL